MSTYNTRNGYLQECGAKEKISPSPDPVVVRLEREVEEAISLMNTYAAKLAEADADNARLRGLLREACDSEEHFWNSLLREYPDLTAEYEDWYEPAIAALEGKP